MHWTESYRHKEMYRKSTKTQHKAMPDVHFTGTKPTSISMGWHSPALGPSTSLALLPRGGPRALAFCDRWIATRQHCGISCLITKGNFPPFRESFCLGIPASSQFSPFCSWTFLLSMPGHSMNTNYQRKQL